MRCGQYAVVDGIEYEARVWGRGRGTVSLFIPQIGQKPDGWAPAREGTWYREVSATEVSDAFAISTRASLDHVAVHVDSVNAMDRTAIVRAVQATSRSDHGARPPHPLLTRLDYSPYSIDWVGKVPWDRLTDVDEVVGRIDPSTGRRIDDDAP